MINVRKWEELCLSDGMIYFWHNNEVEMVKAIDAFPSYRLGGLQFIVHLNKTTNQALYSTEEACVRAHLREVQEKFNLIKEV